MSILSAKPIAEFPLLAEVRGETKVHSVSGPAVTGTVAAAGEERRKGKGATVFNRTAPHESSPSMQSRKNIFKLGEQYKGWFSTFPEPITLLPSGKKGGARGGNSTASYRFVFQ